MEQIKTTFGKATSVPQTVTKYSYSVLSLLAWWKSEKSGAGLGGLNLRLASDPQGVLASEYGILRDKEHIPFRSPVPPTYTLRRTLKARK
jgi:hypothetical protein